MLACVVLLGVALFGSPIQGAHRWLFLGTLRLDVRMLLWPAGALFAGWLCSYVRMNPRVVLAVFGVGFICYLLFGFFEGDYAARFVTYWNGDASASAATYRQSQMRTAIESAKWFGFAGRSLYYLPAAATQSAIAGTALVLGKWTVVCSLVLMGVVGSCLAGVWLRTVDPARRMYILLYGVVLLGAAISNYLQHVRLLPVFGCSFSWLSYGGWDVLCSWLGLGLVAAAAQGDDESPGVEPCARVPWVVSSSVAGILVSALWWGPVPAGARFEEPLTAQCDFVRLLPAMRGSILAADGSTLAKSVKEWELHIDPQSVRYQANLSSNDVVEAVSKGLGLTLEETRTIYSNHEARRIPVAVPIKGERLKWCQANASRCGFVLGSKFRRVYALGRDAVHVTGCCLPSGLRMDPMQEALGVEAICNSFLRETWGTTGCRDRRGRANARNIPICPHDGMDVTTTIQVPIQREVSRILSATACSNVVESAWALAVRIPGGEIVALASYPSFDPNSANWSADGDLSLVNGAVESAFEPGDLMKPLLAAMALDAGCVKPGTIIGADDRVFTNLSQMMGTNRLWQGLQKFGVGKKVEDGLFFDEATGLVPPPTSWTPTMLRAFGIGLGLSMTGVQLARAYATLANGGVRVTPFLVKTISDKFGEVYYRHPEGLEERLVSSEAAAAATKFLLGQTNEVTRVAGVTVAGMSSVLAHVRGQNGGQGKRDVTEVDSLYAGFFPTEKPTYILLVAFSMPQGNPGTEKNARLVFGKIAQMILTTCGKPF